MKEYTNQLMLFKEIFGKKVQVDFNGGQISSDAGVILLRELENKIGLIKRMASVIPDWRHLGYVKHSITQLLTQRVFQIACGYEDSNDSNTLRDDPLFKLGCNKRPYSDVTLASQPTMCRFENAPSRTILYRMAQGLVEQFIDSYKKPPEAILLDIDETDDPTYGSQQMSLFNAYYGTHCYQPIHIYEGSSGKLITSILRPGKRPSGKEIKMILSRIVKKLKTSWPQTDILFRGDAHYSSPEVFGCCEECNIKFTFGLKANAILKKKAHALIERAKDLYHYRQEPIKIYGEFEYQARSWPQPYRVIVKVECNEKGLNVRFIVTNLMGAYRKFVYETVYCGRGAMELMIKELKNHLFSDRTSCCSFQANQFRLFLHSMAYVLLHALREKYLAGTELAKAQFDTIRLKLLKIGARIIPLATKIKIHLPSSCPVKLTFYQIYISLCSP
jgi:hypothetical protein